MSNTSARELIEILNNQDESSTIEAKRTGRATESVLETICAFSNEPGLGGGYLLLGVSEDENSLFPAYTVTGVDDPDKLQRDLATQCAGVFNLPVRPRCSVETINEKNVLSVFIPELPQERKPLYFKREGLPQGAFRRIGSTDHRCTEDDLSLFYQGTTSYDSSEVQDSSMDDVDEAAINRYRNLRAKVNPAAEELTLSDEELLSSLGCLKRKSEKETPLTLAGLILFGKSTALRRLMPMIRVDYIRVPGNEWVPNPDERFSTIDMRGPLLLLAFRLVDAINADLPKGFLLEEGSLQADSTGLPVKALREAIVNALMHRSYRENRPIQVIRYNNRLEIKNPGFSLKPEESLGDPGSETRNPYIAAVFHETNLAETKGTGIRAMRRLLEEARLAPPTFESHRDTNTFTARLLLHHFLGEEDLAWIKQFNAYDLNDNQKQALIFVREVGAIDNSTYRQLSNCETLKASQELRRLRDLELLNAKGKGKGTYYLPGNLLQQHAERGIEPSAPPAGRSTPVQGASAPPTKLTDPVQEPIDPPQELIDPVSDPQGGSVSSLVHQLPENLRNEVEALGQRASGAESINTAIVKLCAWRALSIHELSELVGRSEKYLLNSFVRPLRKAGKLEYTIPDMPNHPKQAYKAAER